MIRPIKYIEPETLVNDFVRALVDDHEMRALGCLTMMTPETLRQTEILLNRAAKVVHLYRQLEG